jgi:predicted flap endonuclease-1-like 5' DNA nuclease
LGASILAAAAQTAGPSDAARIQSTANNRDTARFCASTSPHVVNALSVLALIVLAVAVVVAYRAGVLRGSRKARTAIPQTISGPNVEAADATSADARASNIDVEKARLIVSYEAESTRLRREIAHHAAENWQTREFAEDRRRLLRALADSRDETARYRQLLVDLENNAPPPLLDSPGAPDDLKLIVGIGPVLERMLQQLGISSYRQIARWTDRDIEEFNARLPDFPGRIRRDAWVTQARALHQSKYGEILPSRERI